MPESVQEGREWPEVTIYANSRVSEPPSVFRGVVEVDPPREAYVPVSSPRVLSVEEARKLVAELDPVDPDVRRTKERLTDWAEEATK